MTGQLTLGFLPALAHEAQSGQCDQAKSAVHGGDWEIRPTQAFRRTWVRGSTAFSRVACPDGTATSSYYHVNGKPLGERKVWLQDDYVKFIRLSQWLLDGTGVGRSRLHQQPRLPRQPHFSRDALVAHAVLPPDPCAQPSWEPQEEGGLRRGAAAMSTCSTSSRVWPSACSPRFSAASKQMCLPRRPLGQAGAEVRAGSSDHRSDGHRVDRIGSSPTVLSF